MPPRFCRPARRSRGAYPQRSATSEQRSRATKDQGRLRQLFTDRPLAHPMCGKSCVSLMFRVVTAQTRHTADAREGTRPRLEKSGAAAPALQDLSALPDLPCRAKRPGVRRAAPLSATVVARTRPAPRFLIRLPPPFWHCCRSENIGQNQPPRAAILDR
jgi:hypothetical protein